MLFERAIKKNKNTISINLHIISNSKIIAVSGYNIWRNTIEIKVTCERKDGKANKELISYLSDIFNTNQSNINIKFGILNEYKVVEIKNINYKEIINKMSIFLK